MKGPFARLAFNYLERGFSPLPIAAPYEPMGIKGKEPGYFSRAVGHPLHMSKWQRFCEKPMTPDEIERIIRQDPMCGIGLACGFNDVVGMDVDNTKAYGAIREVLGGIRPPTKVGQRVPPPSFMAQASNRGNSWRRTRTRRSLRSSHSEIKP